MPFNATLPPDFVWREDDDQMTLQLDDRPLARIRPMGAGWVVETTLEASGLSPHLVAVRSVAAGQRWATRWVKERQRLIATACARPDLAPMVVPQAATRRRSWQTPMSRVSR